MSWKIFFSPTHRQTVHSTGSLWNDLHWYSDNQVCLVTQTPIQETLPNSSIPSSLAALRGLPEKEGGSQCRIPVTPQPQTPAPFLPSPAPAGPAHAHPLETRPSALPAHHMRSKSWILEKQQRDHFGKDKTRAEFISSLWQQTCPSSWWSRSCCAPHSPGPLLSPCRMGSLWTVRHKGNGNFHWQVPQLLHFCIILIVLHYTDKLTVLSSCWTNPPLSNTPRRGSFLSSPAPCFLSVYLRKIRKWLASL